MYQKAKDELAATLTSEPDKIVSYQVLPLDTVKAANFNSWHQKSFEAGDTGPSKWEPQTFTNFFNYLSRCKYYVGFGTWIGPTLFFAAQMVDEAFGIEADPVAFARVETNLALNKGSSWASHVHLNPHAVGLGSSTSHKPAATRVDMSSNSAGNSCSGIGEASCGRGGPGVFWKVNTYPLPSLLARWNVPATNELFVKVDVESFECALMPSWVPWITSLKGAKPTFHIAFHDQLNKCSDEDYQSVYQFAKQFTYADEDCMDDAKQTWTCGSGEHIFHDQF